jgi:hypothetical protein
MGMFAAKTNPGFYELGLDTLRAIGLGIEAGVEEDHVKTEVKAEEGGAFRQVKLEDGKVVYVEMD